MKIAYLGAGAAGRYCGMCLHDNTLAAALLRQGEEILLIPMYTPLRTDEESVSQSRIFFGGINVYLQQKSSLFRHTPWFVDKLLDSPKLLGWLSKRSAGMEAQQLGALTVSTFRGEEGLQRKELEKLVSWLRDDVQPDVVHLSNCMLAGAVRQIKAKLGVPVISSLAGEDIFLEQLTEPHYSQARALLRERSAEIDAFTALNHYFADFMADYLAVDRGRIHVIRHGLNLAGHATERKPRQPGPIRLGYFARIAAEKGLHLLAEAFILLAADPEVPPVRLHAAGYMSATDEPYFAAIVERLKAAGAYERFEHHGELDRQQKIAFLQSLDLMSVPTIYHESKGISAIEALANGVPLVVPAHGAFPELIEQTGGGLLCEPENPAALAAAIKRLILSPDLAEHHGRQGQAAIHKHYTAEKMAAETAQLYRRLVESKP